MLGSRWWRGQEFRRGSGEGEDNSVCDGGGGQGFRPGFREGAVVGAEQRGGCISIGGGGHGLDDGEGEGVVSWTMVVVGIYGGDGWSGGKSGGGWSGDERKKKNNKGGEREKKRKKIYTVK